MKRSKAFTLVELLVVVAIIALLVSILLPTLGRARELARQSVCATNVKGVSTGFVMYTNQNNDKYPNLLTKYAGALTQGTTCGNLIGSGNANNLALLVEGGVVSWGTFLCPSGNQKEATRTAAQKMGFWSGSSASPVCNISYGLQVWDVDTNNKCQIGSTTDGGVAIFGDRGSDDGTTQSFAASWSANHPDDGENILYVAGNVKFSKDKTDDTHRNTGGWGGNNVYAADTWTTTDPTNPTLSSNGTAYGWPGSTKDSVLYWKY